MNILHRVDRLKELVVEHGDYRNVAENSGVTYHWLQKFACGSITNPTVANVAKLEEFFSLSGEQDAA